MFRPASTVVLLVAVALAGCSDGGPSASDDLPIDYDRDAVAADRGVILGVVVDATITPIVGASVRLQADGSVQETDENGAFVFADVAPGTHFLHVGKPGYIAAQQSIEVVAGVKEPPVLKTMLDVDEDFVQFYEEYKFDGYIECSVRFVVNALAACSVPNIVTEISCAEADICPGPITNDAFMAEYEPARAPMWVQSEMVWESTQQLGSSLKLMYTDFTVDPFVNYVVAQGTSPLLIQADAETTAANHAGTGGPLTVRVFTGDHEDTGVSLTAQQELEIITHVFHGYAPPEDWRFTKDATVPRPPA